MSRILLIGSGGREHAILDALEHSKSVQKVFISPGNGLTLSAASKAQKVSIPLQPETNFKEMLEWAVENGIDLVVPGPEIPLVDGIHDAFKKVGISCFGPSKAAAQLEGSKAFSKDFMARHYIPTAAYQVFTDFEKAKKFVQDFHGPLVIKASGLAAGKGVILPETKQEAIKGLESIMLNSEFGSAGDQVVIEERLEGQEVSCLAFCDGYTVVPMPGAQDHKRVGNGDTGLNTGGMGAYAPAPCYTPELAGIVKRTVLQATVDAMRREGNPFIGVLYAGIMLTPAGPKVLEFNVRFGDPETQVILPLLDMSSPGASDLGQILSASARGCLDSVAVAWKNSFACTVVAASQGYPAAYEKGHEISIPASFDAALSSSDSSGKAKKELGEQITVFHAGTSITTEGKLVTSGGRVLSVTGVSSTLPRAIQLANSGLSLIKFKGMHFRTDIGYRALAYLESVQKAGTTYADAGVSIDAGNLLVEKIKPFVKATMRSGADAELGGFGGVFDLKAAGYTDPILISGTDGVGTKLKIAQHVGKHDTIGIDLVAMSVNDVLVQGAEPLYFLDYFASSKLEVDVAADVVKGIARGCLESGCALIGGETAEMPGIYQAGEYDLAGFVVGAVERSEILPRMDLIKDGDVLLGLASSGVHSNGYSLVRHVVKKSGLEFSAPCPFETLDKNSTLGEALLTPTRLYVKPLLPVIRKGLIKSMVHITGGGFIDNIPRSIPPHLGVSVTAGTWPFLPVFQWIKKAGGVVNMEMARTFNCGIGMVLVVDAGNVAEITKMMEAAAGEKVYEIGKVVDLKKNDGLLVKMNDMDSKW